MKTVAIEEGTKIVVRTGSAADGYQYRVGTVTGVGPLSMTWTPYGGKPIRGLREKITHILPADRDLENIAKHIGIYESQRDEAIKDAHEDFYFCVQGLVESQ